MKRIIVMLLIACSAVTTITADSSAAPQKKPEIVIATLNAIIQKFGQNEGQVYSVNRNPNTGIIESSIKIVPFRCSANRIQNDNVMNAVAINFPKDEPLAYQFLHVQPGSNEMFSLKVITNDGTSQGTQRIRTNKNQEMWLMCCQNPENPQLRDAYAIVWEHTDEIEGTIYMITSLRPDMYEKAAESRMFKIVGRVDENIKDSLYNIYIAESREALYNLEDHEYVACVPVVNKRFEWQTELTKPCVGRLRCIFPDGELCSAWIDLDFVPGETYNITVHNGYYDEDKDYERRVGRQSGHSLIEPNAVKVVESIRRENLPADATYIGSVKVEDSQPIKPTEVQRMQLKAIFELAEIKMEDIKALYQQLRSENISWLNKGVVFDNITKKNKELDKQFQDVIKVVKGLKMSKHEESQALGELYKEILEFYTEQNKILTEMSGQTQLPKSAQKTQETVSKIIQKYMNEMSKMLMQ